MSQREDDNRGALEQFGSLLERLAEQSQDDHDEADRLGDEFVDALERGDQKRLAEIVEEAGDLASFWMTTAVDDDDEKLVRALLQAGFDAHHWVDLDEPDMFPSVVGYAAARGSTLSLQLLLDSGLPIEDPDELDDSPLVLAAGAGELDAVLDLLRRGATLVSNGACPAAETAAHSGQVEIVEHLLTDQVRAQLGEEAADDLLALADTIAARNAERVEAMNMSEDPQLEALLDAIGDEDLGEVSRLVAAGAPVDDFFASGVSPLHMAAEEAPEALSLLLPHATRVDRPNLDGLTPLFLAVIQGHREAIELLLEAGADPSFCDDDGYSLTEAAVDTGRTDLLRLLVDRGAPVEDLKAAMRTASENFRSQIASMTLVSEEISKAMSGAGNGVEAEQMSELLREIQRLADLAEAEQQALEQE